MGLAIGHCATPHIVTNGKITETAITLAKLAKKEVIYAELSQDRFHESIDAEVINEFMRINCYDGFQNIRENNIVYSTGRGRYVAGAVKGCCCNDMLINPKGEIWSCGCKTISFGTVFEPNIPEDFYYNLDGFQCINEYKQERKKLKWKEKV